MAGKERHKMAGKERHKNGRVKRHKMTGKDFKVTGKERL
jgi:hypothetical protein